MKIKVKDLVPNPYRDMKNYPVNREKIDRLKDSIEQTGFWDNIICRKAGNEYQLAYGHHRLLAIKELGIKEIDIPVKNIPNADMVRIMALENREQEDMSQAIFIETVRAVRDFLNEEFKKYDNWERVDEFIKSLFESPESFTKTKQTGVGRTTILKFLGGGWKQWKIQSALDTLTANDINRQAIETLESTGLAEGFKRAIRNLEKEGIHIPLKDQVSLAETVGRKIKKNKGKTGGSSYYATIEDIIKEEIGERDVFEILMNGIEGDLSSINSDTKKLANMIASLNSKLQELNIENLKTLSTLIIIPDLKTLLTNYGILTEYLGIKSQIKID